MSTLGISFQLYFLIFSPPPFSLVAFDLFSSDIIYVLTFATIALAHLYCISALQVLENKKKASTETGETCEKLLIKLLKTHVGVA